MDFIKKVWNGDESLVFTYWVIAVVGNAAFVMADISLDGLGYYDAMTQGKILFVTAFIAFSILYFIFSFVCVWRSATKYDSTKYWGVAAKIAMIFGAFRTLIDLVQFL